MSEIDPPQQRRAASGESGARDVHDFYRDVSSHKPPSSPAVISFTRRELQTILDLYGRMVAAGEWRDYALDFTPEEAIFSIFRRTAETPLYRIKKNPKLARRQGAYSVVTPNGMVLKRGHELAKVIGVLLPKPKLVLV
jgi:hypothetical protein